ncbi:MAG: hypothetical protein SPL86_12475 [Succiniclasticum sp.]|uniref:hypothetical protein n=1 Tax=Succiniclasticum sp. TaxID=2775030 RepID=UPI002A920E92|nr:hypothetical protein [Succiniclasticum sp.]MDY6292282.1 hypothetical protein [Succiniclasticum sp.]
MLESLAENVNVIAFVISGLISAFALATGTSRFFVGLSIAGLIACYAFTIFSATLAVLIMKICTFVLVLCLAGRVFKAIAR